MNPEVAKWVNFATNEIQKCSVRFNLVPKPPKSPLVTPSAALQYFKQYANQIINYHAGLTKSKSYNACIKTAAAKYRSPTELASIGE